MKSTTITMLLTVVWGAEVTKEGADSIARSIERFLETGSPGLPALPRVTVDAVLGDAVEMRADTLPVKSLHERLRK